MSADVGQWIGEEAGRYRSRGWGGAVAVASAVAFFVLLPRWLADGGWAQLLRLADVDIVAKLSNGRLSTPEALYAVGERGSLAQFNAFVFGVYTVHCVVFWGGNLVVEAIYRAQLPFFERYKAQPGPWPWQKGDKAAREWRALIRRTLRVLAGNFLVSHPVGLVLVYRIVVRWQLASFDARDCPSPTEVFWQICAFMVIEDTLFYWTHRALHDGRIYTSVHKQHHQYKVSVGLASEYAHPVEFLVSNAVPFAAAALLVGAVTKVHASLWLLWTIWRIGETVDGHCGYGFSWSIFRLLPFSGSAQGHDFHHSHNKGNFASFFTWWDWAMGTDVAFRAHKAKAQQEFY